MTTSTAPIRVATIAIAIRQAIFKKKSGFKICLESQMQNSVMTETNEITRSAQAESEYSV